MINRCFSFLTGQSRTPISHSTVKTKLHIYLWEQRKPQKKALADIYINKLKTSECRQNKPLNGFHYTHDCVIAVETHTQHTHTTPVEKRR